MSPLWDHRAQCLVMCGINLVLLLLLLTFRDTLLSYSLVLIRIITAPDIPARRNNRVLNPETIFLFTESILLGEGGHFGRVFQLNIHARHFLWDLGCYDQARRASVLII